MEIFNKEGFKSKLDRRSGGSMISKIIELEKKSKIKFEHVHVKTKNVDDNVIIDKGFKMALECYKKEKKEKLKCAREHARGDRLFVGNVESKCRKESLLKAAP